MTASSAPARAAARRLVAAALGLGIDRILGEPPPRWHPVAAFGRLMGALEERTWEDRRGAGARYTAAGVAIGGLAGMALGSTAAATSIACAGRALGEAARAVELALERGDVAAARGQVRALVGRDPSELDESELARAVVESVAENTVDAVVAPLFWAALGGAPGALGYRAVNTLDSMVGHRSTRYERFGWASARLDDAAAYVPARLTAVFVAMARPSSAAAIWRAVVEDAPSHPSPNAGVAEAAFAAALGLRLGGVNRYENRREVRPFLGDGRPAAPGDIEDAVRLASEVAAVGGFVLVGLALALVADRRPRTGPPGPAT